MATTIEDLPLHERIRNRREDRGMAAYVLARKAGVSPSYISLIETGAKVPTEEVAETIARVLEDDPDLYRAWARLMVFEEFDPPPRRHAAGIAFLRGQGRGVVRAIHGLDRAQQELGVVLLRIDQRDGLC